MVADNKEGYAADMNKMLREEYEAMSPDRQKAFLAMLKESPQGIEWWKCILLGEERSDDTLLED